MDAQEAFNHAKAHPELTVAEKDVLVDIVCNDPDFIVLFYQNINLTREQNKKLRNAIFAQQLTANQDRAEEIKKMTEQIFPEEESKELLEELLNQLDCDSCIQCTEDGHFTTCIKKKLQTKEAGLRLGTAQGEEAKGIKLNDLEIDELMKKYPALTNKYKRMQAEDAKEKEDIIKQLEEQGIKGVKPEDIQKI